MDRGGETLTGVEWVTGKGFKSSGKAWSSSGSSSLLGLEEENEVEEEACWGSSPPRKKRRLVVFCIETKQQNKLLISRTKFVGK